MSKFFYIDLPDVYRIEKMLSDPDPDSRRDIVLRTGNGFADIVRYNRKYETAVFLTVREEDIR